MTIIQTKDRPGNSVDRLLAAGVIREKNLELRRELEKSHMFKPFISEKSRRLAERKKSTEMVRTLERRSENVDYYYVSPKADREIPVDRSRSQSRSKSVNRYCNPTEVSPSGKPTLGVYKLKPSDEREIEAIIEDINPVRRKQIANDMGLRTKERSRSASTRRKNQRTDEIGSSKKVTFQDSKKMSVPLSQDIPLKKKLLTTGSAQKSSKRERSKSSSIQKKTEFTPRGETESPSKVSDTRSRSRSPQSRNPRSSTKHTHKVVEPDSTKLLEKIIKQNEQHRRERIEDLFYKDNHSNSNYNSPRSRRSDNLIEDAANDRSFEEAIRIISEVEQDEDKQKKIKEKMLEQNRQEQSTKQSSNIHQSFRKERTERSELIGILEALRIRQERSLSKDSYTSRSRSKSPRNNNIKQVFQDLYLDRDQFHTKRSKR